MDAFMEKEKSRLQCGWNDLVDRPLPQYGRRNKKSSGQSQPEYFGKIGKSGKAQKDLKIKFISKGRLGAPRPPAAVLEWELPAMVQEIKADRKKERRNHRFFNRLMNKTVPEDFVPNPNHRGSIVPEAAIIPPPRSPTGRPRTRPAVSFFKSLRSRGDILDPSKTCVADAVPRRARRTSGFSQRSSISKFVRLPIFPSRSSMSEVPSLFESTTKSKKDKDNKKNSKTSKSSSTKTNHARSKPPTSSQSASSAAASSSAAAVKSTTAPKAAAATKSNTTKTDGRLKPPAGASAQADKRTILQARAKKRAQRPSWLAFGGGAKSKQPP